MARSDLWWFPTAEERQARRDQIAAKANRPVDTQRAASNRASARARRCPRCERLSALRLAKKYAEPPATTTFRICRWCGWRDDHADA
jgi:hypothetical protein